MVILDEKPEGEKESRQTGHAGSRGEVQANCSISLIAKANANCSILCHKVLWHECGETAILDGQANGS